MKITVNGKEMEVADGTTVLGLLELKEIGTGTVVVELNRSILPAEAFADTALNEGDHLEVLRFVGGG